MEQNLPSAGGYLRHQQHAGNQEPLLFTSTPQQLPSPNELLPRHTAPNTVAYDHHHQQQQQGWYPNHRTSNSRDEPGQHRQQQPQSHHSHQSAQVTVKRESTGNLSMQAKENASSSTPNGSRTCLDDAMPTTSDFVKKLYKMLEDKSFQHVVSWGPHGDCFVVKDMNEFTKLILPRLFKHSNFASFVRQLNKYDFHKVKNTDDAMQFGEQSWTFRHPDFHAERREALENIKRKVPTQRKQQAAAATPTSAPSGSAPSHHRSSRHHSRRHRSRSPTYSQYSRSTSPDSSQVQELHSQITSLQSQLRARETRERELEERLRVLEQGLVNVQRGLAMQDRMVQGLVGGWVGIDGQGPGGPITQTSNPSTSTPHSALTALPQPPSISRPQNQQYAPFLPVLTPGVEKPEEVARASLVRVGEYSRQQQERRARTPSQDCQQQPEQDYVLPTQQDWAPVGMSAEHEGLHVYTVGHLMPRAEGEGWYDDQSQSRYGFVADTGSSQPLQRRQSVATTSTATAVSSTSDAQNLLRVRRSTFVPGWAVPPRVLLVDDDVVSRKLGSKFLQVFGCTIDLAVDGISAVNKMNLEKYDLVLMDIVMPQLDGVSATSMIRQFDAMTPIISMTSNSKPNEIMTYYSSGMNDILPKPFTKEGLLDMLEKHLMHLKVIQQQMRSTSIPRSIGAPPHSDSGFEAAFASTSAVATSSGTATTNNNNNNNTAATSSSGGTSADIPTFSITPPPFGFDIEPDGRINPLAGMGLTDEQYNMILQNLVTAEGFLGGLTAVDGSASGGSREKRGRDSDCADDGMVMGISMGMSEGQGRGEKRSRFEEVE
ncbi:hypothetical protein C0991_006127 [Blastosporella zonata]|nr:hypothetical protein C0991_006127 [Blastosporella zonata]